MPFDQTPIVEVFPPRWDRNQVHVRWTSTAPAGSWHQIYVARKLAWYGRGASASVAVPDGRGRVDVDRVTLAWQGGTFQDADIVGFRIYGSPAPDEAVDYARPLAEVLAYTPGVYTDGYGYGGFGEGGFGAAPGSYSWRSGPLKGGVWQFAVVSFDAAGNEGTPATTSTTIRAAPAPPARNARGERLTYAYDTPNRRVTLNWLASPG